MGLRVALALCLCVLGLEAGYYIHLARGQWQLIWDQVPVESVIDDPGADPAVRNRLLLTQRIRAFARDSLGLSETDSYRTYCDLGRDAAVWALTACPKDRLEPYRWSYPVIGGAPYRGFFDRQRAERARAAMEAKGYDTYLRPVSAYSTLGWFRDPILNTMLGYGAGDLSDLLIHEMTHATVWVPDHADFNESMAGFVGRTGSLAWLRSEFGADSDTVRTVRAERADRARYRRLMHVLAKELDAIYASGRSPDAVLAARDSVFRSVPARYAAIDWETAAYADRVPAELNNARLSLYRTYDTNPDVFDRVYRACGDRMDRALEVFAKCETSPAPFSTLEAWLEERETRREHAGS